MKKVLFYVALVICMVTPFVLNQLSSSSVKSADVTAATLLFTNDAISQAVPVVDFPTLTAFLADAHATNASTAIQIESLHTYENNHYFQITYSCQDAICKQLIVCVMPDDVQEIAHSIGSYTNAFVNGSYLLLQYAVAPRDAFLLIQMKNAATFPLPAELSTATYPVTDVYWQQTNRLFISIANITQTDDDEIQQWLARKNKPERTIEIPLP